MDNLSQKVNKDDSSTHAGLLSLRAKLIRSFVVVGVIGVSIMAAVMLIYQYNVSKEEFISQSRERVELIRTGLLSTMMATGDQETIRRTVDTFKKKVNFHFRMVRGAHVRMQFGDREGEIPRDEVERDVLSGALGEFSSLEGDTFRFVAPFKTDERCGRCHDGMDRKPVPAGIVNGLAEFVFDVSEARRHAIILMMETILFVVAIMAFTGIALYLTLIRSVVKPVGKIADAVGAISSGDMNFTLGEPESIEIAVLTRQVTSMAEAVSARRVEHEAELREEQKKNELIRSFAVEHAEKLGIADQADVSGLIKRLSSAVSEVEKADMLRIICQFVKTEKKEIHLTNDPSLIRPAAIYLTDLIAGKNGGIRKGAMELALEEAITNSMIHGNLEVESILKEEDPQRFDALVAERGQTDPYRTREVKIFYEYSGTEARFVIADMGDGFDWRARVEKEVEPDMMPHGRGIFIIRAFAKSLMYNDSGNSMTITFEI
ncbi:MAG: ATP-binding protein [Nitrospinae bacterium]|nr:ATP-binding protein [Nitrospinota bacterium]